MECQAAPSHSKSGLLISSDKDRDHVEHADTVHCVHCGMVWKWQPGSGRMRGFCQQCNGYICGPLCAAEGNHVGQERMIENIEAGLPLSHVKIQASNPGLILP